MKNKKLFSLIAAQTAAMTMVGEEIKGLTTQVAKSIQQNEPYTGDVVQIDPDSIKENPINFMEWLGKKSLGKEGIAQIFKEPPPFIKAFVNDVLGEVDPKEGTDEDQIKQDAVSCANDVSTLDRVDIVTDLSDNSHRIDFDFFGVNTFRVTFSKDDTPEDVSRKLKLTAQRIDKVFG